VSDANGSGAQVDKSPAKDLGGKKETPPKKNRGKSPSSGGARAGLFLSVFSLLVIAGLAFYAWQLHQGQLQEFQSLQTQVSKQSRPDPRVGVLEKKLYTLVENPAVEQSRFAALQQQVDSLQKRVQAMSNTSRDDWVLAEAEYLLRLANQRLLMERGTRGAQALLRAADEILLELDQVDLLPVREALGQEMIALKMAGHIDRDGLYLRLSAVAGQLDNLPLITGATAAPELPEVIDHVAQDQIEPDAGVLDTFGDSLLNAVGSFSDYIRITRNQKNLEAILSPEYHFYIKQNARLMIERSQLALMREEAEIYRGSLQQAHFWVNKFYRQSPQKAALLVELKALQDQSVVQALPDLSRSLELLRTYIDTLHSLTTSRRPAASGDV